MRSWLHVLLWLLLAGWVGAWGTFAFVIAPSAFTVLPTRLAGDLVSPVLRSLHYYGIAAGLGLAVIGGLVEGRGKLALGLPLVLVLLCVLSQFYVTAEIAAVRPSEALAAGGLVDSAGRFALFHRVSELLFALVGLGALALLVFHARADARSVDSGTRTS